MQSIIHGATTAGNASSLQRYERAGCGHAGGIAIIGVLRGARCWFGPLVGSFLPRPRGYMAVPPYFTNLEVLDWNGEEHSHKGQSAQRVEKHGRSAQRSLEKRRGRGHARAPTGSGKIQYRKRSPGSATGASRRRRPSSRRPGSPRSPTAVADPISGRRPLKKGSPTTFRGRRPGRRVGDLVGDSATAPSLTDFSDFSRDLRCYRAILGGISAVFDQPSEVGKIAR